MMYRTLILISLYFHSINIHGSGTQTCQSMSNSQNCLYSSEDELLWIVQSSIINLQVKGTSRLYNMFRSTPVALDKKMRQRSIQMHRLIKRSLINFDRQLAKGSRIAYDTLRLTVLILDNQILKRSRGAHHVVKKRANAFDSQLSTGSAKSYRSVKQGASQLDKKISQIMVKVVNPFEKMFRPVGKTLRFFMYQLGIRSKRKKNVETKNLNPLLSSSSSPKPLTEMKSYKIANSIINQQGDAEKRRGSKFENAQENFKIRTERRGVQDKNIKKSLELMSIDKNVHVRSTEPMDVSTQIKKDGFHNDEEHLVLKNTRSSKEEKDLLMDSETSAQKPAVEGPHGVIENSGSISLRESEEKKGDKEDMAPLAKKKKYESNSSSEENSTNESYETTRSESESSSSNSSEEEYSISSEKENNMSHTEKRRVSSNRPTCTNNNKDTTSTQKSSKRKKWEEQLELSRNLAKRSYKNRGIKINVNLLVGNRYKNILGIPKTMSPKITSLLNSKAAA